MFMLICCCCFFIILKQTMIRQVCHHLQDLHSLVELDLAADHVIKGHWKSLGHLNPTHCQMGGFKWLSLLNAWVNQLISIISPYAIPDTFFSECIMTVRNCVFFHNTGPVCTHTEPSAQCLNLTFLVITNMLLSVCQKSQRVEFFEVLTVFSFRCVGVWIWVHLLSLPLLWLPK